MKKVKLTALIAAVIAGIGIYLFLKEIGKPQEVPRTAVVVAVQNIPENTLISADMVELRPVANESLQEHFMTDPESVIGLVASGDIFPGEQIISERLVRTGELDEKSGTLAYVIDNGMRAVTISVNTVTGMQNLIRPGNRVDLLLNYSYTPEDEKENKDPVTAACYLTQNLKVLAVGTELGKDGASEYTSVTLQTTPQEAVLISYAEYTGSIRIVMRSPLDTEKADIDEVNENVLREEVSGT